MRKVILYLSLVCVTRFYSQKFTEPSKLKQFNITVNHEDCTIKTQMLCENKRITPNPELAYLWYSTQKIIETKGGFDGKLLHGYYRSFYLNDQLKEQGQLKYGLKNGKWKYWYSDGKIKEAITWRNGKKHGEYYLYNDYGQLMAKGSFKYNKLHGKFYTYGLNGIITEKKKYKNGEEIIPKVKTERITPEQKRSKKESSKKEQKDKQKIKKDRKSKKSDKEPVGEPKSVKA